MKISVDSSALADAVAWAMNSVPSRPQQPVMSGVMLSAQDGTLTVSGFDYESASTATIAAYVDSPGVCLLPGQVFAKVVKALKRGQELNLEVTDKAVISCGTAQFSTQTMPFTDYPTLPPTPPKVGVVDGSVFQQGSKQVTYAAATDEALPIIMAVQMMFGQQVSLLATDRYRMSYANIDWARETDTDFSILLPSNVVDNVARMAAGQIEVFADENRAGFRCGNRTITTSLIAGDYPKVKALYPADAPFMATVSVPELLAVLGRASVIAEVTVPVKLTFDGDAVAIESGRQAETSGREVICAATSTDDVLTFGFNVRYLMEALRVLPSEQVEFGFQLSGAKPVLIREPGNLDAQQLVMPIRFD